MICRWWKGLIVETLLPQIVVGDNAKGRDVVEDFTSKREGVLAQGKWRIQCLGTKASQISPIPRAHGKRGRPVCKIPCRWN
jgi:hypothetical protein